MRLLILLLASFMSSSLFAQVWHSTSPDQLKPVMAQMTVRPNIWSSYAFDPAKGHQQLERGVFQLPLPNGDLVEVQAVDRSQFDPILAAKFPNIETYAVSAKGVKGYLTTGPNGIHGVWRWHGKEVYLDKLDLEGQPSWLSYFTSDVRVAPELRGAYGSHEHFTTTEIAYLEEPPRTSPFSRSQQSVQLRQYDLALACTGEYAAKHGGTVEGALAAMNTALSRINYVLETELAITLQLFADNDDLIFLNPATDPYTNGQAGTMANQNNTYLAANVINSRYDVGHVFGTDCGNIVGTSGGIGTVCGTNKGFGSSCEIVTNDRFYIGVVCHELGHQFGAQHTWNNCPTSPISQFNSGTAFEPGSGTTIMSYAGACGDQNIAFSEDFYFHNNSLTAIKFFVENTGGSCATTTSSTNVPPVIRANHENGFTIPIQTPFRLDATGFDPDGDTISYCWEQYDAGIGAAAMTPITEPAGNGPIFRSFEPTSDSFRIFPRLPKILASNFNNTEILPTYSRDLTFRVTARDEQMGAGAFSWDEVKFSATEDAGPFAVTSHLHRDTLRRGEWVEITWDVADTDKPPVNCQRVNIKMSFDAGNTYPATLALGVPNDGSEKVLIPDSLTNLARFLVEAADNVFFNLNPARLIIAEATNPGIAWDVFPHAGSVCVPGPTTVELRSFALLDFADPAELIVLQSPPHVTVDLPDQVLPGEVIALEVQYGEEALLGRDSICFGLISGGDTTIRQVILDAVLNDFSDQITINPTNGSADVGLRPNFMWQPSLYAEEYRLELAKSPDFSSPILGTGLTNRFVPDGLLDESSLYYWRLIPSNSCGPGEPSEIQAFHTITQACNAYAPPQLPINISQSQAPTLQSIISVDQTGIVSDVNIVNLSGFHESFGDLTLKLISPTGTVAVLMQRECGFSNRQFKLTFDDDAGQPLNCQFNFANAFFKPKDPLAIFSGESIQGDWVLEVSDSVVGSGGRIEDWTLEICGSITPENPNLLLDTLRIEEAGAKLIANDVLTISDSPVGPDALLYTLVALPEKGVVMLDGLELAIGDQFSQAQIHDNRLSYLYRGDDISAENVDSFKFTVIDQQGGWVPISTLHIVFNVEPVGVEDLEKFITWTIRPNPTDGPLTISVNKSHLIQHVSLVDMVGREYIRKRWPSGSQQVSIQVGDLSPGLYSMILAGQLGWSSRRLVIQR